MADQFSTGIVKSVRFSFMTDEEVEKLSFQKIRNPILLDTVGRPTPEGLYDPALGPLDDNTPCKTCGQLSRHCTGHCGHIELVSDVYNPLLFSMLFKILQKTCFFCHHFKVKPSEVDVCVSKLELIKKGCIVAARKLDKDSGVAGLVELSEEDLSGGCGSQIHLMEQKWTSLQHTEVMSVLNYFLLNSKKKCQRCGRQSPAISKPTFGWIYMTGKSDWHDTSEPLDDGDDKSASEVEDPDGPALSGGGKSRRERKTSAAGTTKKRALSKQTMLDGPETLLLGQKDSRSLWPIEVRKILKGLWNNEAQLCDLICNIQLEQPYSSWKNAGYSMFFLKKILVPPIKFRPPTKGGDSVLEHVQTVLLVKVLESNISLGNACEHRAAQSTIVSRWKYLQQSVNILFDSKNAAGQGQKDAAGICQQLERKEGVFRQKMMGKRVNFACRSVISPDPYLAVNEIGLPPYFALRLTYPERVTPWNVTMLRDAVINGPETHPGATHYIDKSSILLKDRKSRIAISRKLLSSRGGVMQPGRNCNYELESKVVYRHIRNGDIVLVNRQPTLHKPSIIALRVRVLPGEKTLRMHYANCDSFNADFDGDEINVHFPQDEISRSEGYNIVNADDQYIVPTRGDPKRALIQDHIVGAVLLTKRDTFLTWDEFSLLLYSSGLCSDRTRTSPKSGQRVSLTDSIELITSVPPAILKPCRLWTGKQVITAILQHITRDQVPFVAKKRAKIAREYFGKDNAKKKNDGTSMKRKPREDCSESIDEDVVFIYKNELVQGVIDKEQFGKFGLVHTVQELYGSSAAGNLLSVLGRVLTTFLQLHGFTCGVDDLLLVSDYDRRRKQLLDVSLNCGDEVHLEFVGRQKEQLGTKEMQIEVEKAIRRNGESAIAILDGMMRNKLNSANSSLSKLFPDGLSKPFRQNCLSLMTLSGAKGGTFNFQQISLLLGQQELEGKRVPRMVSGKTLPCFPAWDTTARAGGFISDRYLTGLRPQEFYFHCMAGREGLVDTAVKTSRSGYLQRCLIKNLESLQVNYDYTVRDADGSIIQFRYGEDGVDVHQKNFLQEFDALAMNQKIFWKSLLGRIGDGCMSKYIEEDNEFPDVLSRKAEEFLNDETKARNYGIRRRKDRLNFVNLVKNKYFMSLAQPGEPVGVIAAQSVGEPSTQMTLNTFHHAGRGEMNVTLGIPRLQEILMTASANIRTPTMTCPLFKSKSKGDAECVAANLRRVTVADIIENIQVCVVPFATSDDRISSFYKLMIKLYKPDLYPPNTDISIDDCKDTLETVFLRALEDAIQNHLLLLSKISGINNFIGSQPKASDEAEDNDPSDEPHRDAAADDDDNDEKEGGGDDLGLDAQRSQQQATDEVDYEDASDDELKEGDPTSELETEADQGEANDSDENDSDENDSDESDSDENSAQDEPQRDSFVRSEKETLENKAPSKDKSNKVDRSQVKEGKQRRRLFKKETDRAVYMSSDGLQFEVHFKFTNEPHILLSEIVQKTARKVYVKRAGKIDQCKVVELHLDDPKVGGIPMLRKGKETRPALQTSGVDFVAFWRMQNILDINCISTNDVNAMLNTYGVEAARATIITEVFRVFNHYGVSVDMRHLCLIADFMTHSGEYRALNRTGRIKDSISPFGKMSFETASRFIVEAATHGQEDTLETPSARICLGLPPKVGTGCFDLLQKLDI